MVKNIKNSGSGSSKNIRNDDSLKLSVLKVTDATITNANITNLTNTELQTATSNITTLQATTSANSTNIATNQGNITINQGNIATNTSSISINQGNIATNSANITDLEDNKQDAFTVSDPLDLTNDVLTLTTDNSFFTVTNGELQLKVILDFDQNVFINTNDLTLQNAGGPVTLDLLDNTNNYGFRIFFNNANQNTNFRIRGATGGYIDIMTLTQADIDFHTLPLLNVASINGITSTEIGYLAGVTSSLQFQLDQKQAVLTAGNGIDIVSGLGTTISVDEAELTTKQNVITAGDGLSFTGDVLNAEVTQTELDAKQDVITDSTNIELNRLDVNDKIRFQRNNSSDTATTISRSNNAGKMKLVANEYAFRNSTDGQNNMVLNDSGTLTTVSVQADFFSSISDTELDYLLGVTSSVQTQIDGKQDTITSSTALSVASIDLNSGDVTNGGAGNFTTLDLGGSVSGVTSLRCQSIEISNSSLSNAQFIDFGTTTDYNMRQTYNEPDNNMQWQLKDSGYANAQTKLQINYDTVQIHNADFDVQNNDIINVNSLNGITDTEIGYLDGVTSNLQTQLDDKADEFALNLPLELDTGAFPDPAIKLNYNTDQFKLTGSNLELNRNIVECKTTNFNLSSSGNWGSTSSTYPYISGWGSITALSGTSFLSNASDGIFSVSATGLYKITLNVAAENVSVNNRIVVGVYLSVDDADTSFRSVPGEFLLMQIRDDNQSYASSSSTTIYKTLTDANTLRFKTRLGVGSDNRNYNDQRDDANLNIYTSLTLERIG